MPKKSLQATRKQAEKDSKGRLRLYMQTGIAIAFCGLVFWLGKAVVVELDRPIANIQISGNTEHINSQEIEKMVQSNLESGVLTMDLNELRSRIQDRPWVANVTLRKHWPGTLQVKVLEHQPIAYWNEVNLVTASGDIFAPEGGINNLGLPQLGGPNSDVRIVLERFTWLNAELKKTGLSSDRLRREQRGSWEFSLLGSSKFSIFLGRSDLDGRLNRFAGLYKSVIRHRVADVQRVDLRYANGVAVEWVEQHEAG